MRSNNLIARLHWHGLFALLAIAAAALLAGCPSQDPAQEARDAAAALPPPHRETILLQGATVVDVRSGALARNMDLLLKDGRIEQISPAGSAKADGSMRRIDAQGTYVVPGFSDMHVHVLEQGHLWESLSLMLANGVTGFRQMSGSMELLEQRKNGTLPIRPDQPELLAMPGAFFTPWNAPNPQAAVASIDQQVAAGADFIKIGIVDADTLNAALAEGRRLGIPVLGHVPADVDPVVAAQGGMRSIEHLGPFDGILFDCATDTTLVRKPFALPAVLKIIPKIPFGKDLIDHVLPRMLETKFLLTSPEEFDRMRHIAGSYSEEKCRGVARQLKNTAAWQVPTLWGLKSSLTPDDPEYTGDAALRYLDPDARERKRAAARKFQDKFGAADKQTLKDIYAADLKLVKMLDEAHVPMLAGTDAGPGTVGWALHREFDNLGSAGLAPLRVLQMATMDAAEFLGRSKTMGTVEPGKTADLVLLDANPIDSTENLHKIHAVIRAGYYYSKSDLDALKADVEASVAKR